MGKESSENLAPDLNQSIYQALSLAMNENNHARVCDILQRNPDLNLNFYVDWYGFGQMSVEITEEITEPFLSHIIYKREVPEDLLLEIINRPNTDINKRNAFGQTIIHNALLVSSEGFLSNLLKNPKIDLKDIDANVEDSLLLFAISYATPEKVAILLENGYEPNAIYQGKTVLDSIVDEIARHTVIYPELLALQIHDWPPFFTIEEDKIKAATVAKQHGAICVFHQYDAVERILGNTIANLGQYVTDQEANLAITPDQLSACQNSLEALQVFRRAMQPPLVKSAAKRGAPIIFNDQNADSVSLVVKQEDVAKEIPKNMMKKL